MKRRELSHPPGTSISGDLAAAIRRAEHRANNRGVRQQVRICRDEHVSPLWDVHPFPHYVVSDVDHAAPVRAS